LLKYDSLGIRNESKIDHLISDIVPEYVEFLNNEILQLDFYQKLILGDASLRHTYDKLILAYGLKPNLTTVTGLLYSLIDKSNPIFTGVPPSCHNFPTLLSNFFSFNPNFSHLVKFLLL